MNTESSVSFHDKACALGRTFTHHKAVPFEVGYRWAKDFLQEAFYLAPREWSQVLFAPCPEHAQLALWISAFIEDNKPLSRSLGRRFFWNSIFTLNEATLDPRPETEGIIELVLRYCPLGTRILDLGTGSGCILLSLLQELKDAQGVGVDIASKALGAAEANAETLALSTRVIWMESSWYEGLFSCSERYRNGFDIVVSNPPYIATSELCTLQPEVQQWDPVAALDGGVSGIEPYETIIPGAKEWLASEGIVVLEIPHQCAQTLLELGRAYFSNASLHQDMMRRWRYLLLRDIA